MTGLHPKERYVVSHREALYYGWGPAEVASLRHVTESLFTTLETPLATSWCTVADALYGWGPAEVASLRHVTESLFTTLEPLLVLISYAHRNENTGKAVRHRRQRAIEHDRTS